MEYLVSVVVPTKNRYKYLKYLIRLIDSFNLPELELVIQDNSDDNSEILQYLEDFINPNIKYYYSSDKLTMSGNAELGIMNATGEYICYIGDDDGVCRNIVECVRWMKVNNYPVAISKAAWFFWGGKIRYYDYRRPPYEVLRASEKRDELLQKGMGLTSVRMPKIYQAIVRKDILGKMFQEYKTLFPSVPPDVSGALFLSFNIESFVRLNIPVIIGGSSAMTGGGVVHKGGVLPLKDVSFISDQDIIEWEKNVPPIWCGHYAWLNSGIKTLKFLKKDDLVEKIDIDYNLAGAVARRPRKNILHKYSWEYANNKFRYTYLVFVLLIKRFILKFVNNSGLVAKQSKGINNILEAERFFTNHTNYKFDI